MGTLKALPFAEFRMSRWKRDVVSGLIVVTPILVSLYVVAWFYWQIAGIPILSEDSNGPERVAVFLSVFSLVVLSVGYLMRTTVGRVVEGFIDDLANRVPLVRVVYNASKMAVETTLTGTEELQTPVKLEPWNGMRLTAFKTGKTTDDGRDVLFMPTAPNITSGFVVEVHPDDYEVADERVEDALTRILSAGFGESQKDKGVPIQVEPEEAVQADGDGGTAKTDESEADVEDEETIEAGDEREADEVDGQVDDEEEVEADGSTSTD